MSVVSSPSSESGHHNGADLVGVYWWFLPIYFHVSVGRVAVDPYEGSLLWWFVGATADGFC